MTALTPIPTAQLDQPADFAASVETQDLVYFCCNVGDADAQLILVPGRPPNGERRAIIVDAGISGKIDRLLKLCVETLISVGAKWFEID